MASEQISEKQVGTLYGVGVGPGDPELITLKAQRILRRVPVLCLPKSRAEGESYALSFVSELIDADRQEVLLLVFPMTKDRAILSAHWEAALEQVVSRLRTGQDLAFVTEGDPSIYSTFMHLHALLRERHPDIPVEVIPGVSSINAAAAVTGQPLVDGAERLAVLPATYEGEGLEEVLRQFDTIVLLKVNQVFDRVLATLESLNLAEKSVYVRRCGSPQEEVVRDIRSLRGKDLDYLSLLIVRK